MRVFGCLWMSVVAVLAYEGCRRGTRGRGGSGARGNLVSFAAVALLGDFREAAMSSLASSSFGVSFDVPSCSCLRLRFNTSSLCNLILMDRLEGAMSSPSGAGVDFDLVLRAGVSSSPLGVCSSASESVVTAVDEDVTAGERFARFC